MTIRDNVLAVMIWTAFSAVIISSAEEIAWLYEYFIQNRNAGDASRYAGESQFVVIGVSAIIIGLCSITFSDPKGDADQLAWLKLVAISATAGMILTKAWIALKTQEVETDALSENLIRRTFVHILAGFAVLIVLPVCFPNTPKLLRHALLGAIFGILLGVVSHGILRIFAYYVGVENIAEGLRPGIVVWSVFAGMFALMLQHLGILRRISNGNIRSSVILVLSAISFAIFVGLNERSNAFIHPEQSRVQIMAYYSMLGACLMVPGVIFYAVTDPFHKYAVLTFSAVASAITVTFGFYLLLKVGITANLSSVILGASSFATLHIAVLAISEPLARWAFGDDRE